MSVANLPINTPPKMPSFCGCLPRGWVSHLRGLLFGRDEMPRKPQDLTGKTFGRLTALMYRDGYWMCKCECGAEATVKAKNLNAGNTKSCGCLNAESLSKRAKSFPCGTKFGNLTVMRPSQNKGRRSQSICLCDCGNEVSVNNYYLQTADKPSCGCVRSNAKRLEAGIVFGRLTVLESRGSDADGHSLSLCRCECGQEVVVINNRLRSASTQSCGCLNRECLPPKNITHGMSDDPVYKVWCQMWQRCTNESVINYHVYGGRGIRVCDRWKDFALFTQDMGPRPSGYTIERQDSNGNYEPSNCCWATRTEQNNNTSRNRRVTIGDRTMTVSQWARETGLHKSTITERLNRGLSGESVICVR